MVVVEGRGLRHASGRQQDCRLLAGVVRRLLVRGRVVVVVVVVSCSQVAD